MTSIPTRLRWRHRCAGSSHIVRVLSAALLTSAVLIGTTLTTARPAAAETGSRTFNYTGGPQYFTAPTGITEVLVEAWGAQGDGTLGGKGGYVRGTLTVTPGQTLQVNVGGGGMLMSGGWNGGGNRGSTSWSVPGGGGGASDVRGTGFGISDRLLVAGGGGGQAHSAGGDGGYPEGTKAGDNGTDFSQQGAEGGYGGKHTQGGWGGFGYCGSGADGSLGAGGTGGSGTYGGGGGGGGYYGGGGGGTGCSWGGAAGGGGSSWVDLRVAGAVYNTGVRTGHGKVTIAWMPDAMAVNVAASTSRPDGYSTPETDRSATGQADQYLDHCISLLQYYGTTNAQACVSPGVNTAQALANMAVAESSYAATWITALADVATVSTLDVAHGAVTDVANTTGTSVSTGGDVSADSGGAVMDTDVGDASVRCGSGSLTTCAGNLQPPAASTTSVTGGTSSDDNIRNMRFRSKVQLQMDGEKIAGTTVFNLYKGEESRPDLDFWSLSAHGSTGPGWRGHRISYAVALMEPATDALEIMDWQPASVANTPGGTMTVSANVAVHGASLGISRTWERPSGESGGGYLRDHHSVYWKEKSGTHQIRALDGVNIWKSAPDAKVSFNVNYAAAYRTTS